MLCGWTGRGYLTRVRVISLQNSVNARLSLRPREIAIDGELESESARDQGFAKGCEAQLIFTEEGSLRPMLRLTEASCPFLLLFDLSWHGFM